MGTYRAPLGPVVVLLHFVYGYVREDNQQARKLRFNVGYSVDRVL